MTPRHEQITTKFRELMSQVRMFKKWQDSLPKGRRTKLTERIAEAAKKYF